MRQLAVSALLLLQILVGIGRAAPIPKLKPGDLAPDFALKDQNGKSVSLHDYQSHKTVVLAFYVFAFTGG
jgi:cytochrome oxidase Cu insertion factor (SCO1/SenC/PrrC family)